MMMPLAGRVVAAVIGGLLVLTSARVPAARPSS
jgi:hypothetical protein